MCTVRDFNGNTVIWCVRLLRVTDNDAAGFQIALSLVTTKCVRSHFGVLEVAALSQLVVI